VRKKKGLPVGKPFNIGDPSGIRTRVTGVKGRTHYPDGLLATKQCSRLEIGLENNNPGIKKGLEFNLSP
jgi:hypothetical protein